MTAVADVVAAEYAEGDFVRLRGRLHSWRYQVDGQWQSVTEVTADEVVK